MPPRTPKPVLNVGDGERTAGSVRHSESESSDSIGLSQRIGVLTDGNQSALARKIGARSATISEWVSGKYPPSYESLLALVAATGCDPGWLLTGRGEPFPAQAPETQAGRARVAAMLDAVRGSMEKLSEAIRLMLPLLTPAERTALVFELAQLSTNVQPLDPPAAPKP